MKVQILRIKVFCHAKTFCPMFYLLKRKFFRQKVFILQRKIFSLKKYYPIFDMRLLNANATINRPAVFPTGISIKSLNQNHLILSIRKGDILVGRRDVVRIAVGKS